MRFFPAIAVALPRSPGIGVISAHNFASLNLFLERSQQP